MKSKLTILLAVLGLMTMSGVSVAAEGEDDTVFDFGYDADNGVFVWGTSPSDGLYDCSLESKGELEATYSVSVDGLVYVDGLTDGSDSVVAFDPRPQDQLADGLTEAAGPVEYTGAEGECGLSGGSVAGPQGQINHGMFLKLFNGFYEGPGRGCIVRHVAQSDLGKGGQQVKVSDVDPDAEPVADGDTGTISFDTIVTDCIRESEQEVDGDGNGKPAWAGNGKPDHAGQGKPPWAGNPGGPGGGD
ncbi:MAG: hypothetical protein ACRDU9_04295 [Acidimicrobiia bacterium]